MSWKDRLLGWTPLLRVFADAGCLYTGYLLAGLFCFPGQGMGPVFDGHNLLYLVFLAVAWFIAAAQQNLFQPSRDETLADVINGLCWTFLTSFVVGTFLMAVFVRDGRFDRAFYFSFCLAAFAILAVFRMVVFLAFWNLRALGYHVHRALIIGSNENAERLVKAFIENKRHGYHVRGFLEADPYRSNLLRMFDIPYMGGIDQLQEILASRVIDGVYIALPLRSHYETIREIAHLCEGVGVPVRLVADLFPTKRSKTRIGRKGRVALVSFEPASEAFGGPLLRIMRFAKRLFTAPETILPAAQDAAARAARRFRNRRRVVIRTAQFIVEGGTILAAFVVAEYALGRVPFGFLNTLMLDAPYLVAFGAYWLAQSLRASFWDARRIEHFGSLIIAVSRALGEAFIFCIFVMMILAPEDISHRFLAAFGVAVWAGIVLLHLLIRLAKRLRWSLSIALRRVAIIGANERTLELINNIAQRGRFGYSVVGILDDDAAAMSRIGQTDIPFLGTLDQLSELLQQGTVEELFVSLPLGSHYEAVRRIITTCESYSVTVHLMAELLPLNIATTRLMYFEDIPLLSLSAIPEAQGKLAMKRAFDLLLSSVLIVLAAPIFLSLAILIKLDSKGPVFFRQDRVGHNRRRFKMIKFRSMIDRAEELRNAVENMNELEGPIFKAENDPRLTRVGKFLRRFSLDELPQLFNVWLGEMSLVGPRPPIPMEVEQYTWSEMRRLSVRPGITGLWQVSGRSAVPFKQGVQLDLAYIDTWSLAKDLHILWKTLSVVLTTRGAV